MKNLIKKALIIIRFFGLFLFILVCLNCNTGNKKIEIEGIWQGALEYPGGIKLRVIFNISKLPNGELKAVVLRPDLDDDEIPVKKIIFKKNHLHMILNSVPIYFEGNLDPDKNSIDGGWIQGKQIFPLVLHKINRITKPQRPQEPKRPFPYREKDVVFENLEAPARLSGTLTLPQKRGLYPAVLLISGGGDQNRDSLILGHRPFLVIADHLTRKGIAVLRFDDRGIGSSTGDRSIATTKDYAQDAYAGVKFLKNQKEIDSRHIGLIGHSEGSSIASLVAAKVKDIAFVILLAGPGLPGEEYNYQYTKSVSRILGHSEDTISAQLILQKQIFKILLHEKDSKKAESKLRKILEGLKPPMPQEKIESNLKRYLSPWFRFSINYDPGKTLKRVKCPVLALYGEKDIQVPPAGNAEAVKQALCNGGNEKYEVKVLPGLNHLFQTAESGAPSEYSLIEETISPKALELMTIWIMQHTAGEKNDDNK